MADAHEEEVQAHADGCSRLHYALFGTDDEDSSDDEAVEALELTHDHSSSIEAILEEWHFCICGYDYANAMTSYDELG